MEAQFITPVFRVDHAQRMPTMGDWRDLPGLEVKPPEVWRYFVRVKPEVLQHFIQSHKLYGIPARKVEDEFVAQNCYRLNQTFYASLGEKKAFVLSQGRNMMILKIVGYAEEAALYYQLLDFKAHVWIAHQRYPTRGRVWHPGGAHPFAALERGPGAQRRLCQLFRGERILEPAPFLSPVPHGYGGGGAHLRPLAPTLRLSPGICHRIHGPHHGAGFRSPACRKGSGFTASSSPPISTAPRTAPGSSSLPEMTRSTRRFELIGITDTSMLRPQVFALQDGEVQIGLICSEKQAIDATLASLAAEDPRFCPVADLYWNARGGSATDGGAFIFSLEPHNGRRVLDLQGQIRHPQDGALVSAALGRHRPGSQRRRGRGAAPPGRRALARLERPEISINGSGPASSKWSYATFRETLQAAVAQALKGDKLKAAAINGLTLLLDRRYDPGDKKRSHLLRLVMDALTNIFQATPKIGQIPDQPLPLGGLGHPGRSWPPHPRPTHVLVLDAAGFPPEGDDCDARFLVPGL